MVFCGEDTEWGQGYRWVTELAASSRCGGGEGQLDKEWASEREKGCVFSYSPFASSISQGTGMLLSSRRIVLKAVCRDEEARG